MKIGIFVHSVTGHTYSVAEKIAQRLMEAEHSVVLEKVTATNDQEMNTDKITMVNQPNPTPYDVLILGSPIYAFAPSAVIQAYLKQMPALHGQKVLCFVTGGLPYPWMGGRRAIRKFTALCEAKGGQVMATGIVNWPSSKRSQQIDDIVARFTARPGAQ